MLMSRLLVKLSTRSNFIHKLFVLKSLFADIYINQLLRDNGYTILKRFPNHFIRFVALSCVLSLLTAVGTVTDDVNFSPVLNLSKLYLLHLYQNTTFMG